MHKKQLENLFEKYKDKLILGGLHPYELESPVIINLTIPTKMIEKYMEITSQKRKNPISFWKRMDLQNKLLTIQGIGNDPELRDALDYLGNVHANFEKLPYSKGMIRMYVEERNTREVEEPV